MQKPIWRIYFSPKFSNYLKTLDKSPLDKWRLANHIIIWRHTKNPFRGIKVETCQDQTFSEEYVLVGLLNDGLGNHKLEVLLKKNNKEKKITVIFTRKLR